VIFLRATTCVDLLFFVSVLLLTVPGPGVATAQMAKIDIAQSDLVKKSPVEQSAILAEVIRAAWKGRTCTGAKVSLEKTYDDRSGGWLVLCDEGQDYWVLVRDQTTFVASALPCILARQSGMDCYANVRTVQPEDIKQCAPPSGSLDRVIRSCTAIIQSLRFDNRPDVMFLAHTFRALAYGTYSQLDWAIADFDEALALQPGDIETPRSPSNARENSIRRSLIWRRSSRPGQMM
jgi:hypothetical protein